MGVGVGVGSGGVGVGVGSKGVGVVPGVGVGVGLEIGFGVVLGGRVCPGLGVTLGLAVACAPGAAGWVVTCGAGYDVDGGTSVSFATSPVDSGVAVSSSVVGPCVSRA